MALKRRVGSRMYLTLLIVGNIATALAISGVSDTLVQDLDCTNDLEEKMSCCIDAQNCKEYSLILEREKEEFNCTFEQCDDGQCCCSIKMMLIYGEEHNATVRKGGESIGSKIISVIAGINPSIPTNISVKESNGNFQVKWKSNEKKSMEEDLSACVTYRKKGDTEEVPHYIIPTKVDGFNYFEIDGGKLESRTTYVVSVKSKLNTSGRYSDSSEEIEFTTRCTLMEQDVESSVHSLTKNALFTKSPEKAASPNILIWAIILSLSIATIIISGALYGCYVKLKAKWWDTVAKCPNPKLLHIHLSEQEILKPVFPDISPIFIEPFVPEDSKSWCKESLKDSSSGSYQQSSGISTGSSTLSYANTEPVDIKACVQEALGKALPNISPTSPVATSPLKDLNRDSGLVSSSYNPCGVRADNMSMGSLGLDNRSYSLLIPSFQHQVVKDSSDGQTQVEMLCDSAYHPPEGNIVIDAEQQAPASLLLNFPPMVSSLVQTDMSYQQCNAGPERFSCTEDSSLSSISSGTNTVASCDGTFGVETESEGSDVVISGATKLDEKTEEVTVCDENPCYGCMPTGSHSFPLVDDNYQTFQSVVEQPDIMFTENRRGNAEEHSTKGPEELFTKMPQSFLSPVIPGFLNSVQEDQCLSQLQGPLVSLISAKQSVPIITDSGYQSV